ncbi:NUDIX hydrolase domain-like protein [Scenedesmus sp. NREL 46B-D3]|nr:NUDIX hydrolase domain-like protein [Scenedesmus sp. NREL 46B-D3]
MPNNEILTFLKAAHRLKNLVNLLRTAWNGMIRRICCVLPSALIRHLQAVASHSPPALFRHSSTASSSPDRQLYQQPMVRTRASRRRNEGLHHIAERLRSLPEAQQEPVSSKLAAVLVPLFQDEDGVVKVWLTQRAMHLNSHKGEVCLPGGKRDPTDPDDAFTAKREAHEEMGLQPSSAQVLCQLPPMLSKHLYSVTPVVALVPDDFQPQPNADEVDAVFAMPLSAFLDAHQHIHWDMRSKAATERFRRVHSFDYQGYVVWGLTALIMIQVAELALGRPPDFEVEHPSNVNKPRM